MMNTIKRRLLIWLVAVILAIVAIFSLLIHFHTRITKETAAEISSMYMSEMMYQLQDHFDSIIDLKTQEASYIAEHAAHRAPQDPRADLVKSAGQFGFDYLAFCNSAGAHETIMGETAWYRNLTDFIQRVTAGECITTTGYLTNSREKYLVFGVPAQYTMDGGAQSEVLLLGFNVERLYDHIHIDGSENSTSETRLDIVLTNGSYVATQPENKTTSYFDHILQYGSFVGTETAEGVIQIEKAMAGNKSFSHTVTLHDITKHIYGAPAWTPNDWYFVLSMPQGVVDTLISNQDTVRLQAFGAAGCCIALLFLMMFLYYMRMSARQIRETEKARNDAEIANSAKSSFLSNMSHDIRTPMNAIAGFSLIAEESIRKEKKAEALDALSKLKRSSEYLRNLIGDVLDMSKIESGTLALMHEAVSLSELIETVDTIAKVRTEMKEQRYELRVHDIAHDAVICDRTRLEQVLINLLGNAVKFTDHEGHILFEVWQEPSDKGDDFVRTTFVIQDNGIGMSPDFMTTMFHSFSREENRVRKIEGTGLGLAISKNLADMMGGTLGAQSKEGEGSRFCFTVDLLRAEEAPAVSTDPITGIDASNLRILMAEDNDFNYEIAQVLLEGCGFAVQRAENGEQAVDLYCSAPQAWDLILMDLRMPVMDGYAATEGIRRFEATQAEALHIPIFALSADVFEEDIRQCLNCGMDGHISKPIDMSELLRKINHHLRHHATSES